MRKIWKIGMCVVVGLTLSSVACKSKGEDIPIYPGMMATPRSMELGGCSLTERKGQSPDSFEKVVAFYDEKVGSLPGWSEQKTSDLAMWTKNMKEVGGGRPRPVDESQAAGMVQVIKGYTTLINVAKCTPK